MAAAGTALHMAPKPKKLSPKQIEENRVAEEARLAAEAAAEDVALLESFRANMEEWLLDEAKGEDAGKESDSDSDSDDDDDDIGDMAPPPPRTSVMRRGRRRTAVSAEAGVDPKLLRQKWEAEKKTYEKSDAEKDHIRTILKANIFLKNLDDDQTDVIVDSMVRHACLSGYGLLSFSHPCGMWTVPEGVQ